jgi:hypothetical protein
VIRGFLLSLLVFGLSLCEAAPASTAKDLENSLKYYRKTSIDKNLTPNHRLYILYQIQKKYEGSGLDLSSIEKEIQQWEKAKKKEAVHSSLSSPQKLSPPPSPSPLPQAGEGGWKPGEGANVPGFTAPPSAEPGTPMRVVVKPLRVTQLGMHHEVLALAPPESDVLRIFFRTNDDLSPLVQIRLEEEAEVRVSGKIMPYKEFRLAGDRFQFNGSLAVAFRVPKAWIGGTGLTPAHIALYAGDEKRLKRQPTRVLSEGDVYIEFRSETKSLGRWVLGGDIQ